MNKLFKQYNLKWIGSFINVFYLSLPIFGIATNVMEAGTFYGVQKTNIHHLAPWLSFQLFMAGIVVIGLIILVAFFKFVYPSYYAFLNKQSYMHQNPMQKDLAELLAKQKKIMKYLKIDDEEE
jgi:hypothetical protein